VQDIVIKRPVRSAWRKVVRKHRRRAIAWTVLTLIPVSILVLSLFVSVGYRWGHTMVEVRDGMVGYYTNPAYKNFVWLDQGRKEGWLRSGPAKVPPGQYQLYASNRFWTALYVKMWHIAVLTGAMAAWYWRKGLQRDVRGKCFACGYLLTGVPKDARGCVSCPECGAVDDDAAVNAVSDEQAKARDSSHASGEG
jgi:hypothetical protein